MSEWGAFLSNIVTESFVSGRIELDDLKNDYERAEFLQNIFIGTATNDGLQADDDQYKILRRYFLEHEFSDLVPTWVSRNRDLASFWQFIKQEFAHYQQRRDFIRDGLNPLLTALEKSSLHPISNVTNDTMQHITHANLHPYWNKALKRVGSDPEGAITLAKTLLEGTCKEILEKQGIEYNEKKITLSELYKETAKSLKLHPSQHVEKVFKSILGGCSAIVGGIANIRNELSDAHHRKTKPSKRHAELVVNIAGSVAEFLFQTFNEKNKEKGVK